MIQAAKKEQDIQILKTQIVEKDKLIEVLAWEKERLTEISNSYAWRIEASLRRLGKILIPDQGKRRRLLERMKRFSSNSRRENKEL